MILGTIISLIGVIANISFNVGGIIMSAIQSANTALDFYAGLVADSLTLMPAPFTSICAISAGLMIFTKARRG